MIQLNKDRAVHMTKPIKEKTVAETLLKLEHGTEVTLFFGTHSVRGYLGSQSNLTTIELNLAPPADDWLTVSTALVGAFIHHT